jgi:hypothetical protein
MNTLSFAIASLSPPPNPVNKKTVPTKLLGGGFTIPFPKGSISYEFLQKSYLQSIILLHLHLTYVEHF